MIVRLMGEGQYRVADELANELNELDTEAVQAVEDGNERDLHRLLESISQLVLERGKRLHDTNLGPSDLIVPPADLTLAEARSLFSEQALIPDLSG